MPADAAAEEQFGPYLVYERLGVGGMATVHRALERGGTEGFERAVALKRLLPHLAEDASFIKAFVREAKLAAFLHHVNIVQIYELGRVGTEYFISMEYIDGRDIRRILRHARKATGPPPLHVTVGLLTQLCDALDYAHHKMDDDGHPLGLVHRDVSPSNLLVTTQGHLKVIDFGIAKAQSSQLRTQTGRVKGKLAYMAPEAIGGRELDARSDLFAAGVIAHELLTARPLFASKNEYQTLLKVQRGDILPPSAFNQACMPEMDAIVMKALAREPDDRYPSAAAMREDLGKLRRAHGLATGVRDIASWIDWAFSIELPAGFGATSTVDQTGSAVRMTPPRSITPISVKQRAPTPRPEDEEAVEIAWGGGAEDGGDAAGPLVLDDIPDVSGKHLALPRADATEADHEDDIPAAKPTHGERIRSTTARSTAPPVPRARASAPPVTSDAIDDPASTGRLAARGATEREPRPDDTIPSGIDARKLPTERMAALADDPIVEPPPPPSTRARTTAQRPSSRSTPMPPADLVRASAPMIDGFDIPPLVQRSPTEPAPTAVAPGRIPRTNPGHQPARRTPGAGVRSGNDASAAAIEADTARRASHVTIGASMIERERGRSRWWIPASLGLLVLCGGGAALYAFVLHPEPIAPHATSTEPTPTSTPTPATPPKPDVATPPAAAEPGTVKFVMEPADAEIRIAGHDAHMGSPWSTELAPGAYPIEIRRSGYQSWLTTVELSTRETQTMRVVLEPIGGRRSPPALADATLVLTTTPPGLEVVLDGTALTEPTPVKLPIHPGPHTIAVRRGGIDIWHQAVTARPDATYEYTPSFTGDKEHERVEHPRSPGHRELVVEPQAKEPPAEPALDASVTPPPVAIDPPPVIPQVVPPPPPVPTPVHSAPQPIVPPNAVTRISGEPPSFTALRGAEMPAVVSAKLCIDVTGHVTSADVMGKVDRRAASDIADALRTWLYAPYKTRAGAASGACFVVAMRTR